ncbi:MAG: 2,3-bisphosphoglycerate-independent phosphoglycerate mutase [Salibacteraceae bacterium]
MNKTMLNILDGWGIGDGTESDGIAQASTPNYDRYMSEYPNSRLKTYGEHVGLPEGQMGNSEVGHLNIGAGRIVYQDLARINAEVTSGKIAHNPALLEAVEHSKTAGGAIHLMGLLSHGGVHSSQHHLYALIACIEEQCDADVFIHAFTDGRDVDPKSAINNIRELEDFLQNKRSKLATMIGRYYAMDRDNRWERIRKAYDLLVHGKGKPTTNFVEACSAQYEEGITDEFFEATVNQEVKGQIQENDTVICFNYRTDRCREITEALTQRDMPEFGLKTLPLHYVTMTRYNEAYKQVHVMYEKENLHNTLGEVISKHGGSQLRIAETEKYPHVTFFFSGGRETVFEHEDRIVVDSPKVATYDLQPEMSADEVATRCIEHLKNKGPNFICLNFANPDMVGHTGVEEAIKRACEHVDQLLGEVVENAVDQGYSCLIIADHGNADKTKNSDGSPHTAHTMNPVPCILVGADYHLSDGILGDVAPTLLQLLGVSQPKEMTGQSLLQ